MALPFIHWFIPLKSATQKINWGLWTKKKNQPQTNLLYYDVSNVIQITTEINFVLVDKYLYKLRNLKANPYKCIIWFHVYNLSIHNV